MTNKMRQTTTGDAKQLGRDTEGPLRGEKDLKLPPKNTKQIQRDKKQLQSETLCVGGIRGLFTCLSHILSMVVRYLLIAAVFKVAYLEFIYY